MKANEIIEIIEKVCPENLAYPWDNVGLLCGDGEKEVNKVFVTLDTNIKTVKEAIEKGADMIVSHHPILLGGIKRIDYTTSEGQMIKLLIENNIPLFAAHTNMDTAKGGINDKLAEMFNLTNIPDREAHQGAQEVAHDDRDDNGGEGTDKHLGRESLVRLLVGKDDARERSVERHCKARARAARDLISANVCVATREVADAVAACAADHGARPFRACRKAHEDDKETGREHGREHLVPLIMKKTLRGALRLREAASLHHRNKSHHAADDDGA